MQHQSTQTVIRFPIGHSDLHDIKRHGLLSVDKTKLIIDIHENKNSKLFFLSRPACFGKSSIISMLNYFYDHENNMNYHNIFDNCIISEQKELMEKYNGKFTVININFIDLASDSYPNFISNLKRILSQLYSNFTYVKQSLNDYDQNYFNQIATEKILNIAEMEIALTRLCHYICDYNKQYKKVGHHEKPIILIDEFDMPLHSADVKGLFYQVLPVIKNIILNLIKTSEPVFEKAIMTGIYPQTSFFSSFKNISVYSSMQDNIFTDAFGFTENEIKNVLANNKLDVKKEYYKILEKYGHYYCGDQMLFRPCSIAGAIQGNKVIYHDYFLQHHTIIDSVMQYLPDTCITLIKRLLKEHFVTSVITDELFINRPMQQLTISLCKNGKDKFNQETRYALFVDEDNKWFYRYRNLENIDDFKIENINELENASLHHFLTSQSIFSKKKNLANYITYINENYHFKNKVFEILIKNKGLIHLDDKVWLISLLYASGFLTVIPCDNKNNQAELTFMIPNREIYNFYINALNLKENEYPYTPRNVILQKKAGGNSIKQMTNLEFALAIYNDFYFSISRVQSSEENEHFISIKLFNKNHVAVDVDVQKNVLLEFVDAFEEDLEQNGFLDGEHYDIYDFDAINRVLKITSNQLLVLEFIISQLENVKQRHLQLYHSVIPFFNKNSGKKEAPIKNDQHESYCVLQ